MDIKKGGAPDLIFSCAFVFATVFIGGAALKAIWINEYLMGGALFLVALYSFGIGCMGLFRLAEYSKGNKFCDE